MEFLKHCYSDKHSIFRQNQKEGYKKGGLTQYGTVLRELKIELICANSLQAKGRVERSFKTHQDRLVKEMRLAEIKSQEEANEFLKEYLKKHNKKFSVKAFYEKNTYKEKKKGVDLNKLFTIREKRPLSKELSFQYENVLYQVKDPKRVNRLQNQKVHMLETLDGKLIIETAKGETLALEPYSEYKGEVQKTLDCKEIGSHWSEPKKRRSNRRHPWR